MYSADTYLVHRITNGDDSVIMPLPIHILWESRHRRGDLPGIHLTKSEVGKDLILGMFLGDRCFIRFGVPGDIRVVNLFPQVVEIEPIAP